MSLRPLAVGFMLLLSLAAAGHVAVSPGDARTPWGPGPRAIGPILIVGNGDFTGANGVTGGSGTPADPYLIAGWSVTASTSNGIEVRNTTASFIIRNVTISRSLAGGYPYGVYLWNVTNGRVETTNVSGYMTGLGLRDSSNVSISRVNLTASAAPNVQLQNAENVSLTDSVFGSADGSGSNLTIDSNQLLPSNWLNFIGAEIHIEGNSLPAGMIHLNGTTDATIVRNRAAIIFLGYGFERSVTIDSNILVGGTYEIWLIDAFNVTVTHNNVTAATLDGIFLGGVSNATLTGNRVSDSPTGITISRSQDVLVYGNDFVNNTRQALTDTSARLHWNASYPTGGNHWSDYAGVDVCTGAGQDVCTSSDGFGDSPYVIDSRDQDAYPVMDFIGADTTPPTVTISSPASGTVFTTSPITVSGTAYDLGGSGLSRVQVRVNGGPWADATGTNPWSASVGLAAGVDSVDVRAVDGAANPSLLASVQVTYNPPPPPANTPPYANFSWTPVTGNTSTTFTFTSTSYDTQDPATSLQVRWDWEDDGTWDTSWSTTPTVQHQFAVASTYNVTLEVMDTGGLTSNRTTEIIVTAIPPPPPPPLRVTIAASPRQGTMPLTVSFTSSVSGGTAPYQYQWTLGDGSTSPSANTVHIYVTGGNFTVWMTVQDDQGAFEVSNALFVNVTAAAVNLTVTSPTEFTADANGISGTFTTSVTGGVPPYTFLWSFGDGTQSTDANPSHTYASAGNYTVTVTVRDSEGRTAMRTFTVLVPVPTSAPGSLLWPLVVAAVGLAAVVFAILWLRARRHSPPSRPPR